jgi:acetoacetyl-CoA synthetase
MQQLKEFTLHMDIGRDDRMFCLTSCGEPMWNALVSGLATGASLVLYEGAVEEDPALAWRIAAEEGVTVFGVTAAFLQECEQRNFRPGADFEISALRTIVATDPALTASSYHYVYQHVKSDMLFAAQYGHSDIMACFAAGCPVAPVHAGEIQCAALGMKVEVHDDANRPIVNRQGELVCTAAFPSIPLGFWGDSGGIHFRETYFARYPNVWQDGMSATLTPRNSVVLHGRTAHGRKPSFSQKLTRG